jgi:hypothetical protein
MGQSNLSREEISDHAAKLLVFYQGCLHALFQGFDTLIQGQSRDELYIACLGYHYQIGLIGRSIVALSRVERGTFADQAAFYHYIDKQANLINDRFAMREIEALWRQHLLHHRKRHMIGSFFVSEPMKEIMHLLQHYTQLGAAEYACIAHKTLRSFIPVYRALMGLIDHNSILGCLAAHDTLDTDNMERRFLLEAGLKHINKVQHYLATPGCFPARDVYPIYAHRFLVQMEASIQGGVVVDGMQDVGRMLRGAAMRCGIVDQAVDLAPSFTAEHVQRLGMQVGLTKVHWLDSIQNFDQDNLKLLVIAALMAVFMVFFDALGSLGFIPLVLAAVACLLQAYDIVYDYWHSCSLLARLYARHGEAIQSPTLFVTLAEQRANAEVNDGVLTGVKEDIRA